MMKNKKQSGQAMLAVVGLLSVGLLMASTNVMIGIIQHDQTLYFQQSNQGRQLVEAGVEEAIIRLLREPDYQGGQLVIDGKDVKIEVLEGDQSDKVIIASVNYFGKEKKVQAEINQSSGRLEIESWEDI
jgi:hypothetical protein